VTEARGVFGLGSYRAASALAKVVPGSVARATAQSLGLAFAQGMRTKRSMVERHIRRADPTLRGFALRRAVNAAFDSYARYWIESFRLPSLTTAEVARNMTLNGYVHVVDALAQGNGVILALPHLGGWEWAGRWLADRGVRTTVVVEAIEPPELFEWFRDLRSKLGMTVVPLGPEAASACLRALRANEALCLLSDRDIGHGGIEVEFFGERTTLPAGPATLSLRAGAPVLPVAVYFTDRGDGHRAVVRPPVTIERTGKLRADAATFTQALARELEGLIRQAPDQWHLFQPNWPSDAGYGL
jgi:phosphatidylinositol dimannoside acyltransferase